MARLKLLVDFKLIGNGVKKVTPSKWVIGFIAIVTALAKIYAELFRP